MVDRRSRSSAGAGSGGTSLARLLAGPVVAGGTYAELFALQTARRTDEIG